MSPTPHPPPDRVIAFGLGRLPPGEEDQLAIHLTGCEPCGRLLADLPADPLLTALRGVGAGPAPAEDLDLTRPPGGVADGGRPPDAARLPDVPGYEILGVLGRGGMGVVYKARQVALNRLVAVKMVLAGDLADPAVVRRFRAEAEIAAGLDHPNVLPVYEVGDRFGRPYFSMKLVTGGSLADRVADYVGRPEATAALVAALARAVGAAHRAGLVHRDLKPANVLLDPDGTPFVADFGLAKLAAADDGLTRSGAIVGTPNYMAPEQARGERRVSPAADVHALGAILYELLTGRPPFRGPTPLDTVLEVMEREPAHPRALNPAADPELSLVALTCLEKDPARRYASAAALADDLDRRLAGEPVAARRRSAAQRVLGWARREPGLACRLAVLGVIAAVVHAKYRLSPAVGLAEHLQILAVLAVWAAVSLACQSVLRRDRYSTAAAAVWAAADVGLLTGLLILDDSHETPLAVGYGLIVATSGVWLRVGLVWFTTAAAVLGYAALVAHAAATGGLTRAPHHHAIAAIALAAVGAVAAYQVRQARLLRRVRGAAPPRD